MANSFVRYTGNGSTTTYSVPFSYRTQSDVTVYLAGVATSAYTWNAAGTAITFSSAPASSIAIEIRRTTSQATKLVDYSSGSVLTENDLDTDSDQAFYMSQEAIDKAGDVITLDSADFQWDVQSKRLKNVANPTADTDAVNKQFISTNIPNITTVAGIASDVTTVAGISANVTTVASNDANVTTVASNIANVNTVATNIADVVTVANDLNEAISEIETAANDLNEATSEIEVVANNITNVNTVGTNIANVNNVGTDIANVNSVAGNSTNINAVAGNATNINAVNANSSNINAVNANSANINTVAGNNANVSTVAGISGNVTTVAGISADVTAVAGDATDIGTVATDIANVNTVAGSIANVNTAATNVANVNTVAGISGNVTTVAGISSDVTTVATNNANVTTVAGSISNVNSVGGDIANVNSVASNLAGVNSFAERYRIASTAPTASNDVGDLYFDTTANELKVYKSSGWAAAGSTVNGTANRFEYTATSGQTTFTGADSNGATLAYDAGFIDVYLNGVKLAGADYTATTGTSIVLASGANTSDILMVVAYGTFQLANISINDLTDTPAALGSAGQALVVNSGGTALEFSTIQASEITTEGNVFSNYNTISSNVTTTTSSTQNAFLKGVISVTGSAIWTIAGNGTLEII